MITCHHCGSSCDPIRSVREYIKHTKLYHLNENTFFCDFGGCHMKLFKSFYTLRDHIYAHHPLSLSYSNEGTFT